MNHIIALSGGKDSTALALALKQKEPKDYIFISTPTGNELPELFKHLESVEKLLNAKIILLKPFTKTDGLEYLINDFDALPNWRQRWCTRMLKIEPTLAFLKEHSPCIHYVGLRADEQDRGGIYGDVEGVTHRYPFQEWGWGIKEVWDFLNERDIKIPQRTDCAWCYGQRLIEWKRLLEENPESFQRAIELEEKTGHTFRSPGRDTWPHRLIDLKIEFESGRRLRGEKTKDGQSELFETDPQYGACRVCKF